MPTRRHVPLIPPAIAFLTLLTLAALPALAEFEQSRSFQADSLTVNNLIGAVRISGHAGSTFEVLVQVRGRDASPELIEIRTKEGSAPELNVAFPVTRERNYVYPALGSGSRVSFSLSEEGGSWLAELIGALGSRKVTVRRSGPGLEVWADIEIKVPAGSVLNLNHGVGAVRAEGVKAALRLDTHAGSIEAVRIEGDLLADTGSGNVTLGDVEGELRVDTGSGDVRAGSCSGRLVVIDTGSGSVMLRDLDTPSLNVDTGSGDVHASAIRTDGAVIDTGSGDVELRLDRMGHGKFEVDTGSGRVTLALPADASADVRADTGSGGIQIDLGAGVEILRKDDDEIHFRVGSGAARVLLDTGSGGIRIVRAD